MSVSIDPIRIARNLFSQARPADSAGAALGV